MNDLTEVVSAYVRDKRATDTAWYGWAFDPGKVPTGVLVDSAPGLDWYARNVDLKHQLHRLWLAQEERRAELECYYIRDWGGVRTNRPVTLAAYHRAGADENIARGTRGSPAGRRPCACAIPWSTPFSMPVYPRV